MSAGREKNTQKESRHAESEERGSEAPSPLISTTPSPPPAAHSGVHAVNLHFNVQSEPCGFTKQTEEAGSRKGFKPARPALRARPRMSGRDLGKALFMLTHSGNFIQVSQPTNCRINTY